MGNYESKVDAGWVEKEAEIEKEAYILGISTKEAREERCWYLSFYWGVISGTAAICYAQPMSLIKTRMHIISREKYRNTMTGELKYVWRKYGMMGLYHGMSANFLRQLIFTSTRIGFYYLFIDFVKSYHLVKNISLPERFAAGLIAGAAASIITVPMEVAFVRMAADERLPRRNRRFYKHVGDALFRIIKYEGLRSLFVGTTPTLIKGMLTNAISLVTVLAIYNELKWEIQKREYFGKNKKDWRITATAAIISAIISSILISPLDLIKVRVQTSPFNKFNKYIGPPKYCRCDFITKLRNILKTEGTRPFYYGAIATSMFFIPFTTVVFLFYDRMENSHEKKFNVTVSQKNV